LNTGYIGRAAAVCAALLSVLPASADPTRLLLRPGLAETVGRLRELAG